MLLLFSCATKQSEVQETNNLLYSNWQLTHLNNEKVSFKTTLVLTTTRYSGRAACNGYNGSYSISKNDLTFDFPLSTRMACNNLKYEQAYFNALTKINHYKITNAILQFYDAENNLLMTFTVAKT